MTAHSDLLRRAAAKLREHAEAASFPEGWAVCLADSEVTTLDGGYMIAGTSERAENRPDASYIALLHPPVGMALVVLFERSAAAMDSINDTKRAGRLTEAHLAHLADLMEVVRLAREVLRETEVEVQ